MQDNRTEEKPKKKRKKKKRRKKHYLLRFLLIVALAVGIYYFLTSELFDIQEIIVENNVYYTSEQIIDLAKAKTGGNLFQEKLSAMKDRLLTDPYIKTAKVSRKLPDKVVIEVAEREEYASVPYGDSFVIIDREGLVLRQTEVAPALPLLMGMTLTNMEPGTPLKVEETRIFSDTLRMLSAMEKSEVYFKKILISAVVVKAYIYDQLICEGTPENIMENMDGLQDVLYELYGKGIERGVIKLGADGRYSFNPEVE